MRGSSAAYGSDVALSGTTLAAVACLKPLQGVGVTVVVEVADRLRVGVAELIRGRPAALGPGEVLKQGLIFCFSRSIAAR